jgi:Tfp pilus assembly protein PilF
MRYVLLVILSFYLLGCAQRLPPAEHSQLPDLPVIDQNFHQPAELPDHTAFYQLTSSQQLHFLTYFNSPLQQTIAPNRRLFNYLDRHLERFNYQGANSLAAETLENLSGNCLSLALLVKALANLVDIEVSYRVIYTEPVFDISEQTLLSSNHVRSYLTNPSLPDEESQSLAGRTIGIDYFRGSLDRTGTTLSTETFEAMVYNNLAVDAFLANDMDSAYWLSRKALLRDRQFKDSINLIAVIYRRQGDLLLSKQWYELGLRYHPNNASLLNNYLVLAEQLRDEALIADLQQQIRLSNDDNPYIWFELAWQAEQKQQIDTAIYFYRKLIEAAPYLHRANLAMAKLLLQQHNDAAARRALQQALEYSYEPALKAQYQAKLAMLEQMAK